MTRGLDHTAQLGFSIPAGVGPLLGLTTEQIAAAAAMAGSSDSAYGVIRSKPLTMRKGLACSRCALGAMNAVLLAKAGVEGPLTVIEGSNGIDQLLRDDIDIDWAAEGYEGIASSTIKSYNSEIHTQSSIHALLRLRERHRIDPSTVTATTADTTQITYDFTGGGSYGDAKHGIDAKSQADHSLPYLLAVALIDGQVRPARITAETPDGSFTEEVQDFPGMPVNPFTWDLEVAKFTALVAGVADPELAREIVAVVKDLAAARVSDLWEPLSRIRMPAQAQV